MNDLEFIAFSLGIAIVFYGGLYIILKFLFNTLKGLTK